MNPRFLLDTHIVVWWLTDPKKLSKEQARVLRESVKKLEPVGVCAITLLEIAVLFGEGSLASGVPARELLGDIETSPAFRILPFSVAAAAEVAALGPSLRDPADRAIVATARVGKLKLNTYDHRIIDSRLVTTVD